MNSLNYKTWVRLCYAMFQNNVSFLQRFRPGPHWGANSALPEPIAGFTGAYF